MYSQMKLDIELIKQIMTSVEDGFWSGQNQDWIFENAKLQELSFYRKENQLDDETIIIKHIKFCIYAGLIFEKGITLGYGATGILFNRSLDSIDITPYGYDFLSSIKKDEVWEEAKALDITNISDLVNFCKRRLMDWVEKKLEK